MCLWTRGVLQSLLILAALGRVSLLQCANPGPAEPQTARRTLKPPKACNANTFYTLSGPKQQLSFP